MVSQARTSEDSSKELSYKATKSTTSVSSVPKKVKEKASGFGESDGVLKYTPIDEIPGNVERLTKAFHQKQKSHSVQFRLNQIRNVYFAVKDNVDILTEALYKDFQRSPSETRLLEVAPLLSEIIHVLASLHKWNKPEAVTGLPVSFAPAPIYIERVPLGVVLVISPFNYPLLLSVASLVGALSGGNAVVFKPSELTPHFSQLLTDLLTKALDPDVFYAVNGGIPETTALLDQKYDKIMYTGNTTVGKIIAKKAAETLTPVILELGGKSPAFVLKDVKDSDIPTIANRLIWGRFTNGGQTCVAVDYILVHESIKEKLLKALLEVVEKKFYSDLDVSSKDYTHIIHDRAFNNLVRIIKETKGNIVTGGQSDPDTRYIAPTIIDNVDWDDSTMQQEIFGPVLPILTYSDLDEALFKATRYADTPLAEYVFTSGPTSRQKNKDIDKILTTLRAGDVMINDVILHVSLVNAPFGGVGQSGTGSYHGFFSFRNFTHERTTMEQMFITEPAMAARYPPFTNGKEALLQASLSFHNGKTWFGRNGNVDKNGPGVLFSLWHGTCGIFSLGRKFLNSSK